MASIVHVTSPVALIGAGPALKQDLRLATRIAPNVVCVDGGLSVALENELSSLAVIGDLDSVSDDVLRDYEGDVIKTPDQDNTDFDKALSIIDAPLILAVGFLGGRLDHELSVLSGLARSGRHDVIAIGEEDICFLCPPNLKILLPIGTRFSIYPFGKFTAQSEGLKWKLDDLTLHPLGLLGTSNKTTTANVTLRTCKGQGICILPKQHLDAVVSALTGGDVDG